MALFTRAKSPAEMTDQQRAQAQLREGLEQLRQQLDGFKDRLKEHSKSAKRTNKEAERVVNDAKAKLAAAQNVPLMAYAGQIKIFEDHVQTPEGHYPLDAQATFAVDSAGNMAVTRRHTLTRAALLGPFSLFTPKATKHDDRELYFIAEHPEWVSITKLNPDAGVGARQAAAAANLAARQSAANHDARNKLITDAQAAVGRAQQTATAKRHDAQRQLAATYDTFGLVETAGVEVRSQVEACDDPDSKIAKQARRALQEATVLAPTPAQLQPVAPMRALEAAPLTAARQPVAAPAPEPASRAVPDDQTEQAAHVSAAGSADAAESPQSDLVTQIRSLAGLRDSGALSEEEFTALKAKLIAG